jgi:hypothetical protein
VSMTADGISLGTTVALISSSRYVEGGPINGRGGGATTTVNLSVRVSSDLVKKVVVGAFGPHVATWLKVQNFLSSGDESVTVCEHPSPSGRTSHLAETGCSGVGEMSFHGSIDLTTTISVVEGTYTLHE